MLKKLMMLSAILMLMGCGGSTVSDFCLIYDQPISTSADDTQLTRDQVDRMNAAWVAICE